MGARIHRLAAEFVFDAQQLVVLGDALRAAEGAGFDLASAGGHSQIGNGGVFGLAAAVANHAGVAIAAAQIDRLQRCLLYTSPSPRDLSTSRMPSSA